jgi:septum formation protein
MSFTNFQIVLGSRSPRRLELLTQLLPEESITVRPPTSTEEPGFDGLSTWEEIETRLADIARMKAVDVVRQCRADASSSPHQNALILTADTIIVAKRDDEHLVLGQPPEPDWRETVREWFTEYLFGKTHKAATAVCLEDLSGRRCERVAVSEVTFCPCDENRLQWYLDTEEPRGKAGGYGIQGAGSLFVTELKGSLTNVIGLPLEDVWEMLAEFHPELW